MRYLEDAGSTSPQSRLTIMSRKPSASSFRRGLMSSHTSGQRARSRSDVIGFLGVLGVTEIVRESVQYLGCSRPTSGGRYSYNYPPAPRGQIRTAPVPGHYS